MITSYASIFLFKMPSFLPVILNNDFFPKDFSTTNDDTRKDLVGFFFLPPVSISIWIKAKCFLLIYSCFNLYIYIYIQWSIFNNWLNLYLYRYYFTNFCQIFICRFQVFINLGCFFFLQTGTCESHFYIRVRKQIRLGSSWIS